MRLEELLLFVPVEAQVPAANPDVGLSVGLAFVPKPSPWRPCTKAHTSSTVRSSSTPLLGSRISAAAPVSRIRERVFVRCVGSGLRNPEHQYVLMRDQLCG